jgi:hypothetical protein
MAMMSSTIVSSHSVKPARTRRVADIGGIT